MVTQHGTDTEWDPLAPHPDVFTEYEELRSQCPVVHSAAFGGYWMFNRYEDVLEAALEPATFVSSPSPFIENDATDAVRSIPISLNRPEHTQYRRLLDPFFVARRVANFEPTVRRIAENQLMPFLEAGGGDFVREVSYPFPARILCALLGLDNDMWSILKALQDSSDNSREDKARRRELNEKFLGIVNDVVSQRRSDLGDPKEDLLSAIITATIDDAPIEDGVVTRIVHQLFTAGHQTTSRALANCVSFIAAESELQQQLRNEPQLIPGAIEEFLRLRPPLHQIARTVARDVDVNGLIMHPGDRIVLNYASANHDEATFESPDSPDITRSPNRHLTFGVGIHKCLGAPVARTELRVVLEELLKRTSSIDFAEEAPREEPLRSGHFTTGYESLPIRVTAHL